MHTLYKATIIVSLFTFNAFEAKFPLFSVLLFYL